MPKYVVISNHAPMSCPSANAKLRDVGRNLGKDVPRLLKAHGMKADAIFHLDPGHKVLWVFEAPSAEAVRDFMYDGGFQRWNDFEFHMASTLDWINEKIEPQSTIW